LKPFKIHHAFTVTLIYFIVHQVLSFSVFVSYLFDPIHNENAVYWSLEIAEFFSDITLFALAIFYLKNTKHQYFTAPFKFSFPFLLLSIFFGFLIVVIQEPLHHLYQLLPFIGPFQGFDISTIPFDIIDIPTIITSVLLMPILEELVFRKFIFKNLFDQYGFPIAMLCSSILFALIHTPDIIQVMTTFLGGLLAAFIYYKSSFQILYPIIFHITWNFLVHLGWYVYLPLIH